MVLLIVYLLLSHCASRGFTEAAALGTPLFIKPANLGSSIGVSKATTEEEYTTALRHAFQFDTKVIIEEYIAGREIECSVLGNETPRVSIPGEIIVNHDFYSYDAKYLDEDGAHLEIPAHIPQEVAARNKPLQSRRLRHCTAREWAE